MSGSSVDAIVPSSGTSEMPQKLFLLSQETKAQPSHLPKVTLLPSKGWRCNFLNCIFQCHPSGSLAANGTLLPPSVHTHVCNSRTDEVLENVNLGTWGNIWFFILNGG